MVIFCVSVYDASVGAEPMIVAEYTDVPVVRLPMRFAVLKRVSAVSV